MGARRRWPAGGRETRHETRPATRRAGGARVLAGCIAVLWSAGISSSFAAARMTIPDTRFEPLAFDQLAGWGEDDLGAAFDAFLASCRPLAARKFGRRRSVNPIERPLAAICREALVLGPATSQEARAFFEARFRPVRIAPLGEPQGFLTGYYEPIVQGSRVPTGEFKTPIYRRPPDLVAEAKRRAAGALPNKGAVWRMVKGERVPYLDRAEIENGGLDGKGLEIVYLRNPVDAFFIQIQGSARVRLEDGEVIRLNYDAHNGFPYTPVGAVLANRGEIPREEMSMDRIRQWMLAHPDAAAEVRQQNRSFVFFRIADLEAHEEAVGAQGIPLTAGRSIAVDRKLHVYGTPLWIDATLPLTGDNAQDPFHRLMIAQDTGSAIVGPARGDLFFGAGDEAGRIAGRIKNPARFVMLLPRDMALTPIVGPVPQPRPRPKP